MAFAPLKDLPRTSFLDSSWVAFFLILPCLIYLAIAIPIDIYMRRKKGQLFP